MPNGLHYPDEIMPSVFRRSHRLETQAARVTALKNAAGQQFALPRKAKSGSAAGENRDKDNAASILE
jgi:hypothetical protein